MQILRLTPAHPLWPALADYADSCGWIAGPHLADMLRQNHFTGWEAVFAAVAEGRIIGFCTFLQTDYYPENRYWPWISSIFVDESFRRLRVCGQLIAAACDYAREQGFRTVYIPSDMTGFYERYGFRKIDELTSYSGDVDNVFAKDIAPAGDARLVRAAAEDAPLIHRMKHAAFLPLYQRYHDDSLSPALELLSKVKGQLAHPATDYYLIHARGQTIGAMRIVRERTETGLPCCRISPLFILPEHQGQGAAHAALLEAFDRYPEAAEWRLSTILQEHGNCHLYEKLCFRRTMTEPTAYPGMDIVYYARIREDTPMRRLARLTDLELLGREGVSHAAPRLTARAILRNPKGLLAVTHTDDFGIYMLPGGGVEAGESILTALHREIAEETGCRAASVRPLGYVEENRAHADYTQLSYYFVAETPDETLCPHLTALETAHGTRAMWLTPEEAWVRISTPVFERPQGRFLQARDMAALKACMEPQALSDPRAILQHIDRGANHFLRTLGQAEHMQLLARSGYTLLQPRGEVHGVRFAFDLQLNGLTDAEASAIIAEVRGLGIPVWFPLTASDSHFRLFFGHDRQHGAPPGEMDEVYLAVHPGELRVPAAGHDVRPVQSEQAFSDWAMVANEVLCGGRPDVHPAFHYPLCVSGQMRCWTLYHEGRPAAVAAVMAEGSIASLEFVATLPSLRNRGFAASVCAAAARSAFAQGAALLTVRAVDGRAARVYQRLGFTACNYPL